MLKAPIKIEFFGRLCITQGTRVIDRFRTYKTGVLLAYLAYHPGRSHPREELIELLWPECEPLLGRNSLSQSLSSLRHQLEPPGTSAGEVVHADRNNVRLVPEAFTTDVAKFMSAFERFFTASAETERAALFLDLTNLYRGEFLPGFYEDWCVRERERIKDMLLSALLARTDQLESSGDISGATECARRAVEVDPLNEGSHLRLMSLFAAGGNFANAIRQFGILHKTLREELDVSPSDQATTLAAKLRTLAGESSIRISDEPLSPLKRPRPESKAPSTEVQLSGIVAALALRAAGASKTPAIRKLVQRFHAAEEIIDPELCILKFSRATDALDCAMALQRISDKHRKNGNEPQMALHVGETGRRARSSVRDLVDQTLSLLGSGNRGQLLCSEAAATLLLNNSDPDVRLLPLGSYKLAGSSSSQRIYQADYKGRSDADFPPISADPGLESNLPRHLSRFFGREKEIGALVRLCDPGDPGPRLITITGPGGTGKTRLSVETGRALEAGYRNSVWFVELANIAEPRFLPSAILESMGQQPATGVDPFRHLIRVIPRDPTLLILDNFEHWLPDSDPSLADESRSLVQRLLEQVPTLRCLITSRRRLGLIGEQEFFLEPLPVPDAGNDVEETSLCESVQLFLDRAQHVRATLRMTEANAGTIADICRRLEGIPLALELAAAKAQLLTQAQILEALSHRLDFLEDRRRQTEERHQKLRVTIDWSFQMLAPEARDFFASLSVFRGGANAADIEAICDESLALDYLALLQDFSFVTIEENSLAGDMRFRLLETLREYGDEKLSDENRQRMYGRHARHYAGLAARGREMLRTDAQADWLQRLEQDHQNFLTAIDRCSENGDLETALSLACSLGTFWETRGHVKLGRAKLEALWELAQRQNVPHDLQSRVFSTLGTLAIACADFAAARDYHTRSLELYRESNDLRGQAQSLSDLGRVAFEQGDYSIAGPHAAEGLLLWRELQDDYGAAAALNTLGLVACEQGDYPTAIEFYQESLELRRAIGDRRGVANQLNNLGVVYRRQGDYVGAKAAFAEGLEMQRELGNRRSVGIGLSNLGLVAEHERDYETARALQEESLAIRREVGDEWGVARSLTILGIISRHEGDGDAARAFFDESLAICRRIGNKLGIGQTLCQLGDLLAGCEPGSAKPFLAESLSLMQELNNRQGMAEVLQSYSRLALALGSPSLSTTFYSAAAELRRTLGYQLPPFEQGELDDQIAVLEKVLTPRAFEKARKTGQNLSTEQAAGLISNL